VLALLLLLNVSADGWIKLAKESQPKVLLFGLDAGDWNILREMFDQGRCPVLKKMVRDGASGYLETFYRDSPVIWTTIATGRSKDVHGVKGYNTTSGERKVKALWNVVSDYGKKGIFIGWWATYPTEEVNGIIISDQALAGNLIKGTGKKDVIYPASRFAEFKEAMLKDSEPVADTLSDDRIKFRHRWDTAFANIADYLIGEKWDIFSLYLRVVDISSHVLTDRLYKKKGQPPFERILAEEGKEKEYWQTIYNYYERCDAILGNLLKKSGPDTIAIVVSDHGFSYDGRDHRFFPIPKGIVITSGPGIKKGFKIEGATILDVMPTTLVTMGLPVSRELEGNPLLEIFEGSRKIKYVDSYGPRLAGPGAEGKLEKDFVKELKALGYIQ